MRTTMDLNDELLRRAKVMAATHGIPLRSLMERALRAYLEPAPKKSNYKLQWRPERGQLRPGVKLEDRDALFDLMEGRE